ncbi:hypothetical protein LWF15_11305 [Kineosporia rhizophila]|uniref:hypothetical protein n=1 Tax=Kineosporia rhizophila TaxID=84633 RepID=UPI001E3015B1|nr:hypothetical protein [Kineosporia rhizophila]MCE0536098.1 hypothetical protein [Kineosporia rhizophila]
MAGLLAMHALSSGHGKHVVSPIASPDGDEHVHSRDHHGSDTAGVGDAGDALTEVASIGVAVLGPPSGEGEPAALNVEQPDNAVLAVPLADHADPATSHELCPDWLPGHCPSVLSMAPMCQAVLTGAGLSVLLVLLLALAVEVSGWVLTVWEVLAQAGRTRWKPPRNDLRAAGPCLTELCISRT